MMNIVSALFELAILAILLVSVIAIVGGLMLNAILTRPRIRPPLPTPPPLPKRNSEQ